jgi:hypothetical protein
MAGRHLTELGIGLETALKRLRAAGAEVAPGGWLSRVGNIAFEDDALAPSL